jgi:predicted nucleic acid-binding protein
MTVRYLLDTSVYSQPLRRKPVLAALKKWSGAGDKVCSTSIVSVSEVEWGLHLEGQKIRWNKYQRILLVRVHVYPATEDIWSEFSRMKARQQKLGQVIDDFDLLIAATARCRQLIVATLNHRDFSRVEGIAWEDWSRDDF